MDPANVASQRNNQMEAFKLSPENVREEPGRKAVAKYTFYAVELQKVSPWLSLVPRSTAWSVLGALFSLVIASNEKTDRRFSAPAPGDAVPLSNVPRNCANSVLGGIGRGAHWQAMGESAPFLLPLVDADPVPTLHFSVASSWHTHPSRSLFCLSPRASRTHVSLPQHASSARCRQCPYLSWLKSLELSPCGSGSEATAYFLCSFWLVTDRLAVPDGRLAAIPIVISRQVIDTVFCGWKCPLQYNESKTYLLLAFDSCSGLEGGTCRTYHECTCLTMFEGRHSPKVNLSSLVHARFHR